MSDDGGRRQGLAVVGLKGFGDTWEGGWGSLGGQRLGGRGAGQGRRGNAARGLPTAHFGVALGAELGAQAVQGAGPDVSCWGARGAGARRSALRGVGVWETQLKPFENCTLSEYAEHSRHQREKVMTDPNQTRQQ